MKNWDKQELKKMKKVLEKMKGLKLKTNINEKIDEKAKQKLQEYMKNLKIENYPEELIAGIKSLDNLANNFFKDANENVVLKKIEACTFLGNETVKQIANITDYLGEDLINKLFENSEIPHFVEKHLKKVRLEAEQAAEKAEEEKRTAALKKIEKQIAKKEEKINKQKKKNLEKEESLTLEIKQLEIQKDVILNEDKEEKTR